MQEKIGKGSMKMRFYFLYNLFIKLESGEIITENLSSAIKKSGATLLIGIVIGCQDSKIFI